MHQGSHCLVYSLRLTGYTDSTNFTDMKITQTLLDSLTEQAKANPRLRQSYDLRNSAEDDSQRMLNAIEPGSEMPIHRHKFTSETVVCLRGCLVEEFFDETGAYLHRPHRTDT